MSDTILALGITVLLLAGLAAWVPFLYMAEWLTRKNARYVTRKLPLSREPAQVSDASFEREIAR